MKRLVLFVIGFAALVACADSEPPSGVIASPLEGTGNSCSHATCAAGSALVSGCSSCATTVCSADPYCCQVAWDETCVGEAKSLCAGGCESAPAPDAGTEPSADSGSPACVHPVCQAGASLTASCGACAQTVCGADPYCCSTAWDTTCVGEAVSLCGVSCP